MPESTDPLGFNEALKAQGLPEIPLFQPREEYINVRMIWKPKYKPYAEIKASGVPRSPYSLTEPQKLIDALNNHAPPAPATPEEDVLGNPQAEGDEPGTQQNNSKQYASISRLFEWAIK